MLEGKNYNIKRGACKFIRGDGEMRYVCDLNSDSEADNPID